MGVFLQFLVSCMGGPAPGPCPVLSAHGLVFSLSPAASCLLRFPDGSAPPGTSSQGLVPFMAFIAWQLHISSGEYFVHAPRAPRLHEDPACGSGSSAGPCDTGSGLARVSGKTKRNRLSPRKAAGSLLGSERERKAGEGEQIAPRTACSKASYFPAQFYSRVTVTLLGAPASFPPRHLGLCG